jgi:hypothetical protein
MTAPLVPAEVDLAEFAFMPLDVRRLRDSRLVVSVSGDGFVAWMLLVCASWHQKPAASLPDDDRELANLAGFGRAIKEWKRLREQALYGWLRCTDGRLYHPIVAEKALEAWGRRQSYRSGESNRAGRQRRWRERVKELSAQLRALGVTPPMNASLEALEALVVEAQRSAAASTGASTAASDVSTQASTHLSTGLSTEASTGVSATSTVDGPEDHPETAQTGTVTATGKRTGTGTVKTALPPAPLAGDDEGFSEIFEAAWAAYPPREGGDSKPLAWKAWRERLAEGCTEQEMLAGTRAYAKHAHRNGKAGTRFVKQAGTFFGPGEWFRQDYEPPCMDLAAVGSPV